ncbi:nuclease-related domain-containing protein [Pseudoalteromonas ruthenica]|uniref:nuclease-related domain-containing protein n=1 Tax=Pseudoalteromonas ruthenica TaxID=151081 RepID=UPI00110A3433|nr:nuclease-related domain-containing protein [Pseudoalteromonas ruthenica]
MRFAYFVLFLTLSLASTQSSAREYNSAMCILLKQQMAQFDHSRTHPSYRSAKRDYDANCKNIEKRTPQAKATSKPENDQSQPQEVASKPKKVLKEQRPEAEPTVTTSEPQLTIVEQRAAEEAAKQAKAEKTQTTAPKTAPVTAKKVAPAPVQSQPSEPSSPFVGLIFPALIALVLIAMLITLLIFIRSNRSSQGKAVKPKKTAAIKAIPVPKLPKKQVNYKKMWQKVTGKQPDTLDPQVYKRFSSVPVLVGPKAKSSAIEQLYISPYGVFIVARPNQEGDIFGGEHAQEWTARNGDEEIKFDNPITELKAQASALAKVLDIQEQQVNLLVLFSNNALFKSDLPALVMQREDLVDYILSYSVESFDAQQCSNLVDKVKQLLAQGSNAALGASSTKPLIETPVQPPKSEQRTEPKPQPSAAQEETPRPEVPAENVAPMPKPAAEPRHSDPEGASKSAEIHPFKRKDDAPNSDDTAHPIKDSAPAPTPEPTPATEQQEQTPEPSSDSSSKDWSNMSDEEFMAFLEAANKRAGGESDPSSDEQASSTSAKESPASSSQQSHEGSSQGDDPFDDFDPSQPLLETPEPEPEPEPEPPIIEPQSTATQGQTSSSDEELALDIDDGNSQSLDDALAELESALSEQDQQSEEARSDDSEPEKTSAEDENKDKDKDKKSNPFANLSLDPDFKPSEEKVDIGAGPLDDEKPKR